MAQPDNQIKICPSTTLNERDKAKLDQMIERFRQRAGLEPNYVIRMPGRVNLIGDHIDYHGFSVLPMAIDQCIWLCCSFEDNLSCAPGDKAKSFIRIINQTDSYPPFVGKHSLKYGRELTTAHKWYYYVLCGYHGILAQTLLGIQPDDVYRQAHEELQKPHRAPEGVQSKLERLPSVTMLVDSNLPPAAGLSSSSALVCAAAVAIELLTKHAATNQERSRLTLSNIQLAHSCSKFEHLIGTRGGGMDQAVMMTAQENYAKYVEFVPTLVCENIRLPDDAVWLVSHCGLEHEKAVTHKFNLRVLETKLGAAMIAKTCKLTELSLDSSINLGDIKQKLFKHMSAAEIVDFLRRNVFDKEDYTFSEISAALQVTQSELLERFCIGPGLSSYGNMINLRLLMRCEHVFEESERVEQFKSICGGQINRTKLDELGKLMTASHNSLRYKFECSHPALDALVESALEAGALGARLTGAGWGGCIVAMSRAENCDLVESRIEQLSKFTFRTGPKSGCQVFKIDEQ